MIGYRLFFIYQHSQRKIHFKKKIRLKQDYDLCFSRFFVCGLYVGVISVIYMSAVFVCAKTAVLDTGPAECMQKESKFFYFCHNIDGTEKTAPDSGAADEPQ